MKMTRRATLLALVTAVSLMGWTGAGRAGDSTPEAVVESFHTDLLGVMKNAKTLGVAGRYKKFLGLIDSYFDMPLMVAFITSESWRNASTEAKMGVVKAAKRLSAAELAVLFDSYGGETFKTTGSMVLRDKSVLVETALKRENDPDVKVSYRVRKFGDKWRIIDVLLDGTISQLVKRRGEYYRTLVDSGISGLTKLLNAKADEITAPVQAQN